MICAKQALLRRAIETSARSGLDLGVFGLGRKLPDPLSPDA
jgi:hypothetical protein